MVTLDPSAFVTGIMKKLSAVVQISLAAKTVFLQNTYQRHKSVKLGKIAHAETIQAKFSHCFYAKLQSGLCFGKIFFHNAAKRHIVIDFCDVLRQLFFQKQVNGLMIIFFRNAVPAQCAEIVAKRRIDPTTFQRVLIFNKLI